MKLIVGLGNSGKEYDNTRHNVGFKFIDTYLENKKITIFHNKFDGLYTTSIINGEKVIFLKPQKYMNLSGEVIEQYVNFYKIDLKDILIVHDDLDIPCGKIKIKSQGSSGGHNGLKNIELHLGTQNYKRLKIGVSRPINTDIINYVLGNFNQEEKTIIDNICQKSSDIIDYYLNNSFENFMNKYNQN
ncbi:MAG: aminoacyl-tRNA hydrolase [Bacilli bacterium]|nr:aminoacyl-tRNA hydrolase [Bacilli bacterium]